VTGEHRPPARCPSAHVAGRLRCDPKLRSGFLRSTRTANGGSPMTWIKPEFEFVDLCVEVTSYLYRR
jgi:hypothetical protein